MQVPQLGSLVKGENTTGDNFRDWRILFMDFKDGRCQIFADHTSVVKRKQ